MNRRLSGPDSSLNSPLRSDSESEWQDWLVDDQAVNQETALADSEEHKARMGLLGDAMQSLSERERHILTKRRLQDNPTTLEELAAEYGVSRERVRQIEVRAFEKLQKAMRQAAIDKNLVEVFVNDRQAAVGQLAHRSPQLARLGGRERAGDLQRGAEGGGHPLRRTDLCDKHSGDGLSRPGHDRTSARHRRRDGVGESGAADRKHRQARKRLASLARTEQCAGCL